MEIKLPMEVLGILTGCAEDEDIVQCRRALPLVLSGGKGIEHAAAVILDMRKRSMNDSDPFSREEAIKIGVTVRKNHVITNRFPYCKTEYYAKFGEGIDTFFEILDIAIENGILVKAGAYIRMPDENGEPVILDDGTKMQWQGNAKFRAYCNENPEFFKSIIDKIEGNSIIDYVSEDEASKYQKDEKETIDIVSVDNDNTDVLEESRKSKKSKK